MQNKWSKIILIGIIVLIVGYIAYGAIRNAYEKHYIKEIDITQSVQIDTKDTVKQAFDQKDSFILVIGDSRCSHCNDYKEHTLTYYINDTPKYPLHFIYDDKEFQTTKEFDDYLLSLGIADYEASPTTYLVIHGEIHGIQLGDIGLFDLYDFIKKNK